MAWRLVVGPCVAYSKTHTEISQRGTVASLLESGHWRLWE
jgi:hypothetical protein